MKHITLYLDTILVRTAATKYIAYQEGSHCRS